MTELTQDPNILENFKVKPEINDFAEIKPEENLTIEEAQRFWEEILDPRLTIAPEEKVIKETYVDLKSDIEQQSLNNDSRETVVENSEKNDPREEVRDGITYYYDSNGNLYRVGNDLLPNNEYEINGYKYKTDEKGRIISAEGDLHMKDRKERLTIKDTLEAVGKGDQKPTDDKGHLIGDQFDGSNGLENLVPQDAKINRNDFKNFENELAKEVKDGKNVHIKIEPIYDGDSRRPSAIVASYSIDGEQSVRVFPNGKED